MVAKKSGGKERKRPGARAKKPETFSAVAAVKRNARDQLGQPPPGRVLPERTSESRREKHKSSLTDLLAVDPDA